MDENQTIFNNCMKDNGGIYIPKDTNDEDILFITFLELAYDYIEGIRQRNSNLPKVNIYYVNNNSINACAFNVCDKYFIAINTGTIILLKRLYDDIFTLPKLYDNELFYRCNQEEYSATFMYFSVIFLIIHEYSHIRFGHCLLINNLWGNTLSELTSNCLIEDGIFRQTLEMDADCCTITTIVNNILRVQNKKDLFGISIKVAQCILSCYILFKMLDNGQHSRYELYDLESLAKSTHPRPGMRQNYLLSTSYTLLEKYFNEIEVKSILNTAIRYIKKFEETINKDIDLKKLEIGVAYTKKGDEHFVKISNNWEKVRKMLKPFTHDTLAPFEKLNDNLGFDD